MTDTQQPDSATKRKNPKNLRLSDTADVLLLRLADKLGLKQVGVIELAIRRLAESEGIQLPGKGTDAA